MDKQTRLFRSLYGIAIHAWRLCRQYFYFPWIQAEKDPGKPRLRFRVYPAFISYYPVYCRFFTHIQDNVWVERAFKGLRPAVVALIVVPCLTAAKSAGLTWKTAFIAVVAALLIWLLNVSPIYVIIAAAAGGILYGLRIKKD
jgi:hypothetical protein